jgi:hypothetical protein
MLCFMGWDLEIKACESHGTPMEWLVKHQLTVLCFQSAGPWGAWAAAATGSARRRLRIMLDRFLVERWFLVWVYLLSLICVRNADTERTPKIKFNSPTSGQVVSGRTFAIDVEVSGIRIPDDAKGILFLDNGKLLEMRHPHLTVNMDGAGGFSEGQHSLRLVLINSEGTTISSGSVTFVKEGSPEDLAGPFHDSRYDDETFLEVQIRDMRI